MTRPIAIRFAALCCALLTACSPLPPAAAPPQLTHTPGAFVEFARGRFNAGDFQFDYPPSWRLIKEGAANADAMRIILQAPSGGELSFRIVQRPSDANAWFIPLAEGTFLMVTVDADSDASSSLAADFERIIRSIRS